MKPFQKAFLTTPTATKINAALATHGLTISSVSMEKFSLIKPKPPATSPPRFWGILWLALSKSSPPTSQN